LLACTLRPEDLFAGSRGRRRRETCRGIITALEKPPASSRKNVLVPAEEVGGSASLCDVDQHESMVFRMCQVTVLGRRQNLKGSSSQQRWSSRASSDAQVALARRLVKAAARSLLIPCLACFSAYRVQKHKIPTGLLARDFGLDLQYGRLIGPANFSREPKTFCFEVNQRSSTLFLRAVWLRDSKPCLAGSEDRGGRLVKRHEWKRWATHRGSKFSTFCGVLDLRKRQAQFSPAQNSAIRV
jgi:hypothetical protein